MDSLFRQLRIDINVYFWQKLTKEHVSLQGGRGNGGGHGGGGGRGNGRGGGEGAGEGAGGRCRGGRII